MTDFLAAYQQLTAKRSTFDGLTTEEVYLQSSIKPPSLSGPTRAPLQALLDSCEAGTLPRNVDGLIKLVTSAGANLAGTPIDDRDLLLEYLVTLMSDLDDTALSQQVSAYLVQLLFNDLSHPAASSISPRHEFRSADGSGNNISRPTLGAARQPYARSVQTKAPRLTQPDPGLVFDLLLRRKEFKPHPSGLSSLLFAQANLIIHDCFNTDRAHGGINANSSYLDLQTIYGNSHEAQMRVRTMSQGLLHPDTFGDRRLAIMTPSTTALAVMYARNHNFIAKRIYEINEQGAYMDPSKLPEGQMKHQDEDIFQRARLVNCGYYVNVILSDYIPAILNQMGNTEWYLNPLEDMRDPSGARIARATGNQVSAEFSLLYRWHSAISKSDEHWLNGLFHTMFPGRDPASIDPKEFAQGSTKYAMSIGTEPKEWTPHGWQRNPDGKFEDAVLAKVLMDATQEVAGAFQARGHPAAMRIIDSLGIQQSRTWALASLNEFRKFMNLRPYATFAEWNSDPEIASAAEALYGHPDNLELFPGLAAEEAKATMPGAGLCPGRTIGRGILSDAANLIRGDRYFTTDFSTAALTTWGMSYATNFTAGCKKGIIGKMLLNNLGKYYSKSNSVYALFPFVTPERMKEVLTNDGVAHLYSFDRPVPGRRWQTVDSWAAVRKVLTSPDAFAVPYTSKIAMLASNKPEFIMGQNDVHKHKVEGRLLHQALYPEGFEDEVKSFFYNKTHALIKSASVTSPTNFSLIDIVRNVVNVVYPSFVAKHWAIPLREDLGGGIGLSVQELYVCLASQFANTFATFGDGAPSIQWQLGEAASKTGNMLHALLKMRVMSMSIPGSSLINSALGRLSLGKKGTETNGLAMNASSTHFYQTIIKGTKSIEQATNELHGLAVGFCVTQAQQLAQIIEFYLRDENAEHRARLHDLCQKGDQADDEITGYIYEAMRFVGQAPFIPRFVVKDTVIVDGQRNVELKAGDGLFASQRNANMDPSVFEKPELINPRRDRSKYFVFGHGMHQCIGMRFAEISIRSAMRAIFSLPYLRSSPGPAGQFRKMTADTFGNTPVPVYLTDQGFEWPFPVSLQVLYGGEPNHVKRMQTVDKAIVGDTTSQSIVTASVLNGTHGKVTGETPLTPPETPGAEKKQWQGKGSP